MKEHRAQELRRGTSLVGPHRDDFQLMLGGITVSQYASQGQHKTLLVALKVAEFRYLREHREEPPIVLLDDVFSELDAHRGGRIMTLVAGLGQVLVTTTDERVFPGTVSWGGTNRRFRVDHGTVREV
jgi:DNA replication and repair protein RecF